MNQANKQLWKPAEIYTPFVRFGAGLPHVHTRLNKGFIAPFIKSKGQGAKQYYDAFNALLYAVATHLEYYGYDMDIAYEVALDAIGEWTFPAIEYDVWIVEVNNSPGSTIFAPNTASFPELGQFDEQKFSKIFSRADPAPESYVSLVPSEGVCLSIHRGYVDKWKQYYLEPYSYKFIHLSGIFNSCLEGLKMRDNEVDILKKVSIKRRIEK